MSSNLSIKGFLSHSEKFYQKGTDAVVNYDTEVVKEWAKEIIKRNLDPIEAIEKGLISGIRIIGDRWNRSEIFLPEVMAAVETLNAGFEILGPEVKKARKERKSIGKVVMGTVAGDVHDIGKNIVIGLLVCNGFEVYDLGVDVPTEKFIEKVKELNPDIVGMSALLSTTAASQKEVIDILRKEGLRNKVKVMVGGRGITREWADKIGADAYGSDWREAVEKAKELIRIKREKEVV